MRSVVRLPVGVAAPFRAGTLRMVPADVAGELDTPCVDPAYQRWTSSNLAEAFPGPMTALSLELSLGATRASSAGFAEMLPLSAALAEANRTHLLASFGHTIYANVDLLRVTTALAGQTPEEFDHQLFGTPFPPDYRRPRPSAGSLATLARVGVAMGPRVAGLGRAVAQLERLATIRLAEPLAGLDDDALQRRLDTLWYELARGWTAANLATALVSQPMAAIERRHGAATAAAVRAGVDRLESAGVARSARELAAAARRDPAARRALVEPDPEVRLARVRADAPVLGAQLDDVLRRWGHRGPGETELANAVYADDPALLLDAVAKLVAREAADEGGEPAVAVAVAAAAGRAAHRAVAASERRERARDAVVRLTHAARLGVRELGRRLAAAERLAAPGDVFHLLRDELRALPPDAEVRVERRRQERARLQRLGLPVVLEGPWSPASLAAAPARQATTLAGVGASGGTAVGRVRILTDALSELEPDEVLVARVTDVGWTPFFAVAAAVVTDAGGFMAHAAVVARELGIPAVVGTGEATRALRDGQLVEVDGHAGTVTVLTADEIAG